MPDLSHNLHDVLRHDEDMAKARKMAADLVVSLQEQVTHFIDHIQTLPDVFDSSWTACLNSMHRWLHQTAQVSG